MSTNNSGGSQNNAGALNDDDLLNENGGGAKKKGGRPPKAAGIDLSRYNYKGEMSGDDFAAYIRLVEGERDEETGHIVKAGLDQTQNYVFEGYKVNAIRKKIYPKLAESPVEVVGIRFIQDAPVRTTTVSLKDIVTLNAAIHQPEHSNPRNPMIYFLLKKA